MAQHSCLPLIRTLVIKEPWTHCMLKLSSPSLQTLNLLPSAESLFPCKGRGSQVLEIRPWTCKGPLLSLPQMVSSAVGSGSQWKVLTPSHLSVHFRSATLRKENSFGERNRNPRLEGMCRMVPSLAHLGSEALCELCSVGPSTLGGRAQLLSRV